MEGQPMTITQADYPDAFLFEGKCECGESRERFDTEGRARMYFLGFFQQHIGLTGHTVTITETPR
jgi:hypothetical protein